MFADQQEEFLYSYYQQPGRVIQEEMFAKMLIAETNQILSQIKFRIEKFTLKTVKYSLKKLICC